MKLSFDVVGLAEVHGFQDLCKIREHHSLDFGVRSFVNSGFGFWGFDLGFRVSGFEFWGWGLGFVV